MTKTFCPLPFNHLYIKPNGSYLPCCRFRNWKTVDGGRTEQDTNLKTLDDYNSINELLNNSELLDSMRKDMLSGNKVKGCETCYVEEESTGESMRTAVLDEWKNVDIDNPKVTNMEITFGNYCNLACRTCGSSLSTSWQEDDKVLSKVYKDRALVTERHSVRKNWNSEEFKNITSLKITGGEPMLHPDFTNFLDTIIDSGVSDKITLQIFTNSSFIPKKHLRDRLSKFKHVGLWLSIDGIEEQQEYIRHLSKWELVEKATKSWLEFENEVPDRVKVNFAPTVSLYNILTLEELFTWFLQLRDEILIDSTRYSNCTFNVTSWPEYIDIKNLPNKMKITYALKKYRHKLSARQEYDTYIHLFDQVINRLDTQVYDKERIKDFVRINKDMDKIRNQKFKSTFPELFSQIHDYWEKTPGKL